MKINQAVRRIVNDSNKFCCMCLQDTVKHFIRIEDEILINTALNESCLFGDLLIKLFDNEILGFINVFGNVCKTCAKLVVSFYNFTQTTEKNCKMLEKVIENLSTAVDNVGDNFEMGQTIFINLYDQIKSTQNRKLHSSKYKNIKVEIKIEPDRKPFTCNKCYESFSTKEVLDNHIATRHRRNSKKYQCDICDEIFENLTTLTTHKECHIPKFMCVRCGKIFANKRTLQEHEDGHKTTIVCQDCGRIYKNKNTYKKHIDHNICNNKSRATVLSGQFTCDYCGKRYTQKMSLRVHIQYEHLHYKAHECKYCKKKFWAQSRLKMHMIKHTKEKNHICQTCGGKFVTKESLLYHTRIHTGEKPYECEVCGEKFISASRRLVHYKKEHLKQTFQCPTCHIELPSKYRLQKHSKLMHDISYEDKVNLHRENDAELPENVDSKIYFEVYDVIEDDIVEIMGN